MRGTRDLENRAARLVNARGQRPDAGLAGQAAQLIREAYERGGHDTALALAHAYQLFLQHDDLDALRDALTDLLPADYAAPEQGAEGPVRI